MYPRLPSYHMPLGEGWEAALRTVYWRHGSDDREGGGGGSRQVLPLDGHAHTLQVKAVCAPSWSLQLALLMSKEMYWVAAESGDGRTTGLSSLAGQGASQSRWTCFCRHSTARVVHSADTNGPGPGLSPPHCTIR